jgi:ABC-2 type transport system ATP-binding protein
MTVQQTLDYFASFRPQWNGATEQALLSQFQLDRSQKTSHLSKGQRTQLALISAICAEPDLLILDEPTSGLDPIVRREFIRTVIGAYQEADPGRRTVFVSTHLIAEFEGLIDEFTIIEHGHEVLTLDADTARARYQKVYARFPAEPVSIELPGARVLRRAGRELELMTDGNSAQLVEQLRAHSPESIRTEALSLEDIFVSTVRHAGACRVTTLLPGPLIVKEGRALAPIWLGAVVAIIAGTQAGMLEAHCSLHPWGCSAGRFSIGHEYGNRR